MELGGNNALIVCPSADLEMATQSIFFGAVGTAGQRCTSTRRVIMHESIADKVRQKLLGAYKSVRDRTIRSIEKTLMGPLIDRQAVDAVLHSIDRVKTGGRRGSLRRRDVSMAKNITGGCYMTPCLTNARPDFNIV